MRILRKVRGVKLEFRHKPVLLDECIKGLNIKKDGIYVDGTLGGAGHSEKIAQNLSKDFGCLTRQDKLFFMHFRI